VAKKKKRKQKSNRRKSNSGKGGQRAGRPPSLTDLLGYLDSEFPECLGNVYDEFDLEEVVWQLARSLEQQRDERLLDLARHLQKLSPRDPGVQTLLASGYSLAGYPALALKTLRAFLSLGLDVPDLDRLEEQRSLMEEALKEHGNDLELFARQDEARYAISQGRFKQLEKIARDTLKLYPNDAPTRNNLSIAYFQQGRAEKAAETALVVIDDYPENVHALANLIRYLLALGRAQEAGSLAARLKNSKAQGFDRWEKTLEGLSLLGDFEGVLEVFEQCPKARRTAPLYHLAAVAQARRGEWKLARKNWHQALRLNPRQDLAEANLENSKLPAKERHGAWPFEMSHWLGSSQLMDEVGRALSNNKLMSTLADRVPYLRNIIPIVLERAGPNCVRLTVGLALASSNLEVRKLLMPFALGKYGSDEIRLKALLGCQGAGLAPQETVRFWSEGEWRETMLMDYDITWEPIGEPYPKRVEKIASRAFETLNEGRLDEAEKLYNQCLEMVPDTPEFLNNLAIIYDSRGEHDRVTQTFEAIHRSHPEYSRAVIGLASTAITAGRLEEARDYMVLLQEKSRFHVSEFALFCEVQIRLSTAEGDRRAADRWRESWERLEAQDPDCEAHRPASMR
jgi:tetratricopeptide (TPR) repeat protein